MSLQWQLIKLIARLKGGSAKFCMGGFLCIGARHEAHHRNDVTPSEEYTKYCYYCRHTGVRTGEQLPCRPRQSGHRARNRSHRCPACWTRSLCQRQAGPRLQLTKAALTVQCRQFGGIWRILKSRQSLVMPDVSDKSAQVRQAPDFSEKTLKKRLFSVHV